MRIVWSMVCVALMELVLSGQPASASEGFDEVAKLAKSGVTEDVLLKFVNASPVAFDLTVDEILYLNDLGVAPKAVNAIMNHGKNLRSGKQVDSTAEAAETTAESLEKSAKTALDEDAQQVTAAAEATTAGDAETATTDKALGPIAESEGDGKLILASPLGNAVLHEQESVGETVAEPVAVQAPEEGEVTTATFYETLTPYGTWIRIDDAWCWQPAVTVCDPEWQPYCDRGHWLSTDCGWFWQSDYSWGWAPFHYGRWKRCAGYGWLWTPDTVWAPAWVSWRECDSHYGWAPLPPSCGYDADAGFSYGGQSFGVDIGFGLGVNDFCFVSLDRFCDFSLRRHRVPRIECGAIFNRTTIIRNNIAFVNHHVTVNGPRFDRVQKHSMLQFPRLHIADAHIGAGQALTRTAHEDRRNGVLQIYRPQVKAATNETPATIAKKQFASHETHARLSADPKVLQVSRQAEELRTRQLAAQEARRKTAETLQQTHVQGTALRTAELEQKKLQHALGNEQDGARKVELAAKLDAQRVSAENARKQKVELESKAAEERKHTLELAQERNRTLKADAAHAAEENKAKLEAQRKAQLEARQGQLDAQRKAQLESSRQAQLKTQQENAAKLAQLEAQRKSQQDTLAARQVQLDAQRRTQQEAAQQAQLKTQQDSTARQAQLQAQRQAQQEALSARQAQQEAAAAARQAQMQAQRQAQQEAAQQARLQAQHDAQARSTQNSNDSNDSRRRR